MTPFEIQRALRVVFLLNSTQMRLLSEKCGIPDLSTRVLAIGEKYLSDDPLTQEDLLFLQYFYDFEEEVFHCTSTVCYAPTYKLQMVDGEPGLVIYRTFCGG